MITEKEVRQWILQKLYDMGYRYLYSDGFGAVIGTDEIPIINKLTGKVQVPISTIKDFLFKVDGLIEIDGDYLDIEKELGIVDWSKVPVDTPIYVWDDADDGWNPRYFARYEDGRVFAWTLGRTSWTASNDGVRGWDNARIADVDKEIKNE